MTSIVSLTKENFESVNVLTQVDIFGDFAVNSTFIAVAQEVVGLLQYKYPPQAEVINFIKTMTCDRSETVTIRAIEPKYKQIIEIEPLTKRELEVLQLIVDGSSNFAIAGELYISIGTVKTHVRNILKKLCVSDRTQAAIRGASFWSDSLNIKE